MQALNPQQQKAASHGDQPLLIIAGAGTGKTATLAHRVARSIAKGTPPSRICLLTFTRRAAAKMLRRADEVLRQIVQQTTGGTNGKPVLSTGKVWGGTFHAVAVRLLRRFGKSIGLAPGFTIHDRADSEDLMGLLRDELQLAKPDKLFPVKATCMAIYSRCVNARLPLREVLNKHYPWCREHEVGFKSLFKGYTDRKEAQGILDFDDLLLFWREMLADPKGGEAIRRQFDQVLVDEYQDTNKLQAEILELLRPGGTGLTVVGDDAQSIYSFRGAEVRNILDFPKRFLGTRVITLEQNYRSTQFILDAANAVIGHARERFTKNLWTSRTGGQKPRLVTCEGEDEQTDFVIRTVVKHREQGVRLKQQAVLFRSSHHAIALELELAHRNIPFRKYGGLKFIEAAHVKDLLAILRLAENPRDVVAAVRTLSLLPGVGPKRAAALFDALTEAKGDFQAWLDCRPPKAAACFWPKLVKLLNVLAGPPGVAVPAQIHQARMFYTPLAERKFENAAERLRDLEQLENVAGRFRDRATFLTELTLDPPESSKTLSAEPPRDDDYLVLSTMHSAKGLEWRAVYIIHASDGAIPAHQATGDPDQLEEERRLFYVAMTRARDWSYVTFPLTHGTGPEKGADFGREVGTRRRLQDYGGRVWPSSARGCLNAE
ncbi:MAG: ATP-dependent helicase [Planctomycetota bacterium]|nr:ATP-dependent helicase [Planctomycetota bacterium]